MNLAAVKNNVHSVLYGTVAYVRPVQYENLDISRLWYKLCLEDTTRDSPASIYNLCHVRCYGWATRLNKDTNDRVRLKKRETRLKTPLELLELLGWCICDIHDVLVSREATSWLCTLPSLRPTALCKDYGIRSWIYYGSFFEDVVLDIDIDLVLGTLVYVVKDNVVKSARVRERLSLDRYTVVLEEDKYRIECEKSKLFSSPAAARADISLASVREKPDA